ncbi:hypothetical protein CONCODRAFT_68079 [Conidiobolus coronatus NRRL 28638]|uniref:Protein OS-9 homolog n=1 Tax=Conidiobolus coronatus (strain ATCC 28846 / CBS 209.66 / NRRL 28638) TaxID=796925 RepID=A0A137PF76_CONC2|nr:hypothetical protein CONCODRAFT_68079 [Conidiobolus coronatus NRRL 28638]|eukprot:KXN73649.1 hypothetical protein CONCODRAFT_68079 [Conidiobolus coronatus NRRL 28638]
MKAELNTFILTLSAVSGLRFKDLVLEPRYDILYSQYPLLKADKNSYLSFKNIEVDLPDNYESYKSERNLLNNGESEYICETLKKIEEEGENSGESSNVDKSKANLPSTIAKEVALELSQKLTKGCIKATQNYWTYELCFKDYIKQFHIPQEGEKNPQLTEFYLGKYDPDSKIEKDKNQKGVKVQKKKHLPMHYKEDELGNYMSQTWEGGTQCDLTGNSRSTEIKFICSHGNQIRFNNIAESETCKYEIEIHVPLLCKYDKFKPQQNLNFNYITCYKLVNEKEAQKAETSAANNNQRAKTPEIEGGSNKKSIPSILGSEKNLNDGLDKPIPTLKTKLTPKDLLYLVDLAKWKRALDQEYNIVITNLYFLNTKTKNPTQIQLLEKLNRRKADCFSAYGELLQLENEFRKSVEDLNTNEEPFTDKDRKLLLYLDTELGQLPKFSNPKDSSYEISLESLLKSLLKPQTNGAENGDAEGNNANENDNSWLNFMNPNQFIISSDDPILHEDDDYAESEDSEADEL